MTVDDIPTPATRPRSVVAMVVVAGIAAVVVVGGLFVLLGNRASESTPPGASDPAAGAGDPATGPGVPTDGGAGDCPSTPAPTPASLPADDAAARADAVAATLVGCPEAAGTTKAEAAGWAVRVVVRDGESQMGTMDYRVDRVGLTVDGGVITGVEVG